MSCQRQYVIRRARAIREGTCLSWWFRVACPLLCRLKGFPNNFSDKSDRNAKCLPRNEIERFKNNKMNFKSAKELLEGQSFMLVQRKSLTQKWLLNKMPWKGEKTKKQTNKKQQLQCSSWFSRQSTRCQGNSSIARVTWNRNLYLHCKWLVLSLFSLPIYFHSLHWITIILCWSFSFSKKNGFCFCTEIWGSSFDSNAKDEPKSFVRGKFIHERQRTENFHEILENNWWETKVSLIMAFGSNSFRIHFVLSDFLVSKVVKLRQLHFNEDPNHYLIE